MRFLTLLFIFISLSSQAIYFENANGYVDKECPTWDKERFENIKAWKTFGIKGSTSQGFDYEIPIRRDGVTFIWCALVPNRGLENKYCSFIKNDLFTDTPFRKFANKQSDGDINFETRQEQYRHYLKITKEAVKREKIMWPNEGVVLEILSRYYLQEYTGIYPKEDYRIGGGVSYHKRADTNTVGELDILVWDRKSCEVIMVGESKAAHHTVMRKRLHKAKKQLLRFRDFLQKY